MRISSCQEQDEARRFPASRRRENTQNLLVKMYFALKYVSLRNQVRRLCMKKRSLDLMITAATLFAFLILLTTPAMGQGRGLSHVRNLDRSIGLVLALHIGGSLPDPASG